MLEHNYNKVRDDYYNKRKFNRSVNMSYSIENEYSSIKNSPYKICSQPKNTRLTISKPTEDVEISYKNNTLRKFPSLNKMTLSKKSKKSIN